MMKGLIRWVKLCNDESERVAFEKCKIEGFNEGIEAVKESFKPLFEIDPIPSNLVLIATTLAKIYGNLEKLKK